MKIDRAQVMLDVLEGRLPEDQVTDEEVVEVEEKLMALITQKYSLMWDNTTNTTVH